LLHPLLAQLALRRLDVPELDLPGHEPLKLFLKLLDPLDLLASVLRPAHLRGPEAEPDHLLQDDLLLGAFLDPVVKLLACGHESRGLHSGRNGGGMASDRGTLARMTEGARGLPSRGSRGRSALLK